MCRASEIADSQMRKLSSTEEVNYASKKKVKHETKKRTSEMDDTVGTVVEHTPSENVQRMERCAQNARKRTILQKSVFKARHQKLTL